MKKSTKAALLSGLVCPGLGHLLVRRYWRAAVLIAISLLAVGEILYYAVHVTQAVSQQVEQKISRGDFSLELMEFRQLITEIRQLIAASTTRTQVWLLYAAHWGLFVCWLFGIIDSYRLGRREEKRIAKPAAAP